MLRCSTRAGHNSAFISALDWIASPNNPYAGQPAVINHSGFVGTWDQTNFQAYGDAVTRTVTSLNIPFFTSADNFSTNACQFSPKDRAYTNVNHTGTAFVVGATAVSSDNNDYRWQTYELDGTTPRIGVDTGSNGGTCVSAYAPGTAIYGARLAPPAGSTVPYDAASGSSFSSPLVAGMAARYIEQQRSQTGQTPGYVQVYNFLLGQAVTPILGDQTAATYWACVGPFQTDNRFSFNAYRTNPGTCQAPLLGPFQFNSASNTSNARMIFWDAGACP